MLLMKIYFQLIRCVFFSGVYFTYIIYEMMYVADTQTQNEALKIRMFKIFFYFWKENINKCPT